jgi:hypothetical protein
MLLLAEGGTTEYVVTVGQEASPPERHAAEELAEYLGRVAGVQFALVAPEQAGDHPRIAVGPQAALAAGLEPSALDGLGEEGTLRATVSPHLILTGGRAARRGTLYAVYSFLEDELGCRWWTHEVEHIPRRLHLEVGERNHRFVPRLEYREPFWYHGFDGDWAVRNRSNGNSERLDEQRGGHHIYKGFVHTFYPLVPPQKHFDEHPEWYSEIEGKRTYERAQLCLTNPELLVFLVERVKEWLRESPEATIVSVSQNDWHGACQCADCRAVDEDEGSHAGTLLRFVNAVAERIEEEFPHVAVDTLAYQYTRRPPAHTRPRHNVIVRLCSIECNFGQPLTHETNRAFREDIEGWHAICDRLYIWDYTTNFSNYVQPHPNWYVLGENVRFFVDHGVKGVFEQGAYQSYGAEMAELRAWVLAKLLWDPTRDAHALIEEFLTGYFGAAAHHIEGHMRCVHRSLLSAETYLRCFMPPHAPYLTADVLLESLRHLDAAEKAVAGRPDLAARVRLAALPTLYVVLLRWEEVRQHAEETGQAWPLPEQRLAACRRFAAVYEATRMTHLNEGGRNMEWLRAECER